MLPLFRPELPSFDPAEWSRWPLPRRARAMCEAWALQGYGTPLVVVLGYLAKVAAYVGGWLACCATSPALGPPSELTSFWLHPLALQKAFLFSLLFEVTGFGCGSGPLTARYLPPVTAGLHFLWPGTIKLPVRPLRRIPWLGGHRRTGVDVVAYAGLLGFTARAALAETGDPGLLGPVVGLLLVCGALDQTVFLAARTEHYGVALCCFWLAPSTETALAGVLAIQAALWFWAGVSKGNAHFPYVVGVMLSNSPTAPFRGLRKRLYRSFPDDLRPSRVAVWLAHGGTLLELAVPLFLFLSDGGACTAIGIGLMVWLHGFILSTVPAGVPIEWNVLVLYAGFFFFLQPELSLSPLAASPALVVVVGVFAVGLPLVGNLWPAHVSFLLSMRYYAGNWPNSVWVFRKGAHEKLRRLRKVAAWVPDQLSRVYDEDTVRMVTGKVMAFRLMHLHGRVYPRVLPTIADDLDERTWVDGELVAGLALGWNFGDGHLHHDALMAAVQAECGFDEGEVRAVFVESQPLHRRELSWRAFDAATGELARGTASIDELLADGPWPDAVDATPVDDDRPFHA